VRVRKNKCSFLKKNDKNSAQEQNFYRSKVNLLSAMALYERPGDYKIDFWVLSIFLQKAKMSFSSEKATFLKGKKPLFLNRPDTSKN